ncbi:MAG: hypothetical protein U9R20_03280, partial [Thermodesulfobacteriota bacterium]|nr:hypothetical protein [Thermodesulfobacteriota bacterium]
MRKIVDKKTQFSDSSLRVLVSKIHRGDEETDICGLQGSAKTFIASILFRNTNRSLLFITPSRKEALDAFRDLSFFLGEEDVLLFPPWDIVHPDDTLSQQNENATGRAGVLSRLLSAKPAVVVAPLNALMQKVAPAEVFNSYIETISIGDDRNRDELSEKLIEGGYQKVPLVEEAGEFSLRGYIVDIFPPACPYPFRMEFIGDEIESIREFDPVTQRSVREIVDFVLFPAKETILSKESKTLAVRNMRARLNESNVSNTKRRRIVDALENDLISPANPQILPLFFGGLHSGNKAKGLDTFFEYLAENSLIVCESTGVMEKAAEEIVNDADRFLRKAEEEGNFYLEKEYFLTSWSDISRRCGALQRVYMDRLQSVDTVPFEIEETELKNSTGVYADRDGILTPLANRIKSWINEGCLVTFLCSEGNMQKMEHLLEGYSIPVHRSSTPFLSDLEEIRGGRLVLREGRITKGFSYPRLKTVIA